MVRKYRFYPLLQTLSFKSFTAARVGHRSANCINLVRIECENPQNKIYSNFARWHSPRVSDTNDIVAALRSRIGAQYTLRYISRDVLTR